MDEGKPVEERDRYSPLDLTRGHGGAGLFSDGKFSFFPSATALWTLEHAGALLAAYDWACVLLKSYGLDAPPFPQDPSVTGSIDQGRWVLKQYPSNYLSLEARMGLTRRLVREADSLIMTQTSVQDAAWEQGAGIFRLRVRDREGRDSELRARRVLLATGRFGPLGLPGLTAARSFRRLEVGFRIEQPAPAAFFRDMPELDPKLRFRAREGDVEWRTFCACRQGEASVTETMGLWTVSGRADCPPTGRSNIGFNTRILDEELAAELVGTALASLADENSQFALDADEVLARRPEATGVLERVYGPVLAERMVQGLDHLAHAFPGIRASGARLIGPTLEGVGWYPAVDRGLRLRGAPAWVAGDACGLFRGIVAAMISGHYAADRLAADLAAARS